mgnify:CR=1 FL=1
MCLICVEYSKNKLRLEEAWRNLYEMTNEIGEEHTWEKGSIGPGTTFPQEIRVIQSLQTIYESALSSVSGPIQIGLRGTLVVETNAELSVKDEAYA